MTPADLNGYVWEYRSILRRAGAEGWLAPLVRAHLTPCTQAESLRLLEHIFRPHYPLGLGHGRLTGPRPSLAYIRIDFRIGRGRARVRRLAYAISLPPRPGPAGSGRVYDGPGGRSNGLRVGLVLHEAAHVLDHRVRRRFGHGPNFCAHLRRLLIEVPWTEFLGADRVTVTEDDTMAICLSYRDVYARHRGPYTLLLMREKQNAKGKVTHQSDRERGPFSAEEAHETARMLVGDLRDDVIQAWVYSESEQQYIGAYYERGQVISTWSEELERVLVTGQEEGRDDGRGLDVDAAEPEGALLPAGPEPLRGVDAPLGHDLPCAAEQAPAVRDVPAAPAPERRALRRGARLQLDAGNAEAWPRSRGASLVRDYLEQHPGGHTATEIGLILAGPMKEAGVEFPAALVSRLKQAGYLKECDA